MASPSKSQLRAILRERRKLLSAATQANAALAVAERAKTLASWPTARNIALYHPTDGEVQTSAIAAACRQENKRLFLPVIADNNQMFFAQWIDGQQLLENRFGILEPGANAQPLPTEKLDIVFMPLVGWDRKGGRLGMGGGYYDRALAGIVGPQLVGLAHEVQEVEEIPRQRWDIPLAMIITERSVYNCGQK